jgi:hypothetical protein
MSGDKRVMKGMGNYFSSNQASNLNTESESEADNQPFAQKCKVQVTQA